MTDEQIVSVPVNKLKIWADNPRKNDHAVEKLKPILEKHGQRTPIVVWKKNMTVYKGNTTLKTVRALGWKEVKVLFVDFKSEAEAKAYGIADNKASEFSEWDEDILTELLSSEELQPMVSSTGFSDSDLRGLMFEADFEKIADIDEEDTGISATIKIICKPENCNEIRDMLREWSNDCGFDSVEVK